MWDELWWISGESRELVLDGQLVSRDTHQSIDLKEVNNEANTRTVTFFNFLTIV